MDLRGCEYIFHGPTGLCLVLFGNEELSSLDSADHTTLLDITNLLNSERNFKKQLVEEGPALNDEPSFRQRAPHTCENQGTTICSLLRESEDIQPVGQVLQFPIQPPDFVNDIFGLPGVLALPPMHLHDHGLLIRTWFLRHVHFPRWHVPRS